MTVNNSKYNPKTGRRILEVRSHDYQRPLVSTNSPIPHTTSNQKIESTINSNQNNLKLFVKIHLNLSHHT